MSKKNPYTRTAIEILGNLCLREIAVIEEFFGRRLKLDGLDIVGVEKPMRGHCSCNPLPKSGTEETIEVCRK